MQYLTVWDVILTPIYLIILSAIARRQRDKLYSVKHPLRRYYMPGLYVKFGGAIFIALVYQYYYGTGDTFHFYYHSKLINSALPESPAIWIKLLTRSSVNDNPELFPYVSQMYWYNDVSSYTVASVAAVFGLLNGTTYIPIALLFAFFSYTGIWAMFKTFSTIYPKLHKELAIAFLFIPSTFVWGSAVFKDTLCMFGLGWMTYTTFRIFVDKDFSFRNLFLLVLSFYIVAAIKIYILLAFLPALSLWLLLTYSHKIKHASVKWIINLIFVGINVGGFFLITQQFSKELNRYSLENVAETAAVTRGWIGYVSEMQEGSGYDLGEFEPTFGGMISKMPQAVAVTLFRPFPWEVKKVIVALSALEALAFLFFTLQLIFKKGLGLFKWISKDPNLIFFLTFSIIFAFAVGITSYNFGALSRYKVPCLPFYGALLAILMYKGKMAAASATAKMKTTISPSFIKKKALFSNN